jgi:Transposase IS4
MRLGVIIFTFPSFFSPFCIAEPIPALEPIPLIRFDACTTTNEHNTTITEPPTSTVAINNTRHRTSSAAATRTSATPKPHKQRRPRLEGENTNKRRAQSAAPRAAAVATVASSRSTAAVRTAASSRSTAAAAATAITCYTGRGDNTYKLSFEPSTTCTFLTVANMKPFLSFYVANLETIDQFFSFIIDDTIVDIIMRYTNIQIEKLRQNSTKIDADGQLIVPKIPPTRPTEIKAFFGLLLMFGARKQNNIEVSRLWEPGSIFHCPYATAAMPRERFKLLCRNLQFYDIRIDPLSN